MRRTPLLRSLTAVTAAALLTGALAGCSGLNLGGGCEPEIASGDASSIVSATGAVGSTPAVEFPTPLISDDVQRSVVTAGDGAVVQPGATVLYDYRYYDGATGAVLAEETGIYGRASDVLLARGESMVCATAGSRVALTGPQGLIDARAGDATETLVAVIDIEAVFLGQANGIPQLPVDGMPSVVTAVDGEPGVSLTYRVPPEEGRWSVTRAGQGAAVHEGDSVVLNFRGFSWTAGAANPTVSSDTWDAGTPTVVPVDQEQLGDETVYRALVESRVGSQLLLVLPDGSGGASILVLDVLGIADAAD